MPVRSRILRAVTTVVSAAPRQASPRGATLSHQAGHLQIVRGASTSQLTRTSLYGQNLQRAADTTRTPLRLASRRTHIPPMQATAMQDMRTRHLLEVRTMTVPMPCSTSPHHRGPRIRATDTIQAKMLQGQRTGIPPVIFPCSNTCRCARIPALLPMHIMGPRHHPVPFAVNSIIIPHPAKNVAGLGT
jgi:hypothetical protein